MYYGNNKFFTIKVNDYVRIDRYGNMDSEKVPFEMFDKRKDDEVFLEFLLNNHDAIIGQKNPVEKILYSMEISRLLARVAVHERVLSE